MSNTRTYHRPQTTRPPDNLLARTRSREMLQKLQNGLQCLLSRKAVSARISIGETQLVLCCSRVVPIGGRRGLLCCISTCVRAFPNAHAKVAGAIVAALGVQQCGAEYP